MTAKTIIQSLLLAMLCTQLGKAQGGPLLVDILFPKAWPNPVWDFNPNWLDPDLPDSVLQGQTLYVPSSQILSQKQKDYYAFIDDTKQSGTAHLLHIDNDTCRVWLEWDGNYYPSNGEYDCQVDAIPYAQLDQRCFESLLGPYCNIQDNPTFVGYIEGFPWVAFKGLFRKMGGVFSEYQVEKIFEWSQDRDEDGKLRSDLRAELVNDFLDQFPQYAGDIPIDYDGDELTLSSGNDNTAVVGHIIPRLAPEGNGAGRNAYSNAMVISQALQDQLVDPINETGIFPSEGMLVYFEYLADRFGANASNATSMFQAYYVRDWSNYDRRTLEYLTEDETRAAMAYAGMLRNPRAVERR